MERLQMNDFIFENSTKVYFGAGCVGRHLAELLADYGPNVLLSAAAAR